MSADLRQSQQRKVVKQPPTAVSRGAEDQDGSMKVVFPPHSHCVFPIGYPRAKDFKFCCDPVRPGSSYCPIHHTIAYPVSIKIKSIIKELKSISS